MADTGHWLATDRQRRRAIATTVAGAAMIASLLGLLAVAIDLRLIAGRYLLDGVIASLFVFVPSWVAAHYAIRRWTPAYWHADQYLYRESAALFGGLALVAILAALVAERFGLAVVIAAAGAGPWIAIRDRSGKDAATYR